MTALPPPDDPDGGPPCRWWREWEVLFLVGLVALVYFLRLGDVSMRGEEPRRAQVAFEMLQTGDWLVPREQGRPFLSRPPLHNWLIAGATSVCGSRAPWAVRLPSAVAMLLTTLLIYGYTRTGLSRTGALAAAAALPTFGEMLTTGAQAETEMVFVFLVAGSVILWHWGRLAGWPATLTWVVGYVCMGLGVLCKGPQPPVYFLGPVVCYLWVTGHSRNLFSRAHLVGAAAGIAVILGWAIPCADATSWPMVKAIVMSDTGMRFESWRAVNFARHLVQFPLEILGGTLPWSPLLLAFASRGSRRSLGAAHPIAVFMGLCVLVAFPTCWIPPDAQTRYFAPLYPCLAVLIGVVVDRASRPSPSAFVRVGWNGYVVGLSVLMVLVGTAVVLAALFLPDHPTLRPWAEPPIVALAYAAAAAGLAMLVARGRSSGDDRRVRLAVLAIAGFVALTQTAIVTDIRNRRSVDQAGAVAALKARLPDGHRMISFNLVNALFAYHYGQPIEARPLPTGPADLPPEEDVYFCFDAVTGERPWLPFAWEEVGVIPMDRSKRPPPHQEVVVGRRVPSQPHPAGP